MSGVPRSGSTVLAAILNQNKQTHVSTTSGLVFAIDGMVNTWSGTGLLDHPLLIKRAFRPPSGLIAPSSDHP